MGRGREWTRTENVHAEGGVTVGRLALGTKVHAIVFIRVVVEGGGGSRWRGRERKRGIEDEWGKKGVR